VQSTADLKIPAWTASPARLDRSRTTLFVLALGACALGSAVFASWLPLQVSIVTVFLFAGPHNWFEFRYFLMRLPVRFGNSRNFFLTAFTGIGVLTVTYLLLPVAFRFGSWSEEAWTIVIAGWNSVLIGWIGMLVLLRARQKRKSDWSWFPAVVLAAGAFNWFAPFFFSLVIVYLHPVVALWFLDRHLMRTRPQWVRTYRKFLVILPGLLALMIWRLSQTPPLVDDNGLFWRITQHSGAELLPSVSSHVLVSVHLFLEMLHYGVWIIALPFVGSAIARHGKANQQFWRPATVPLFRHPRGFPRLVAAMLVFAAILVVVLWFGFSVDYVTTRDIYFSVAIAHVLAEVPFLLKML
jgi:hypothetical protein